MSFKRFIAKKQPSTDDGDASTSTKSSDQDSLRPPSPCIAGNVVGKRNSKHVDELGPAARDAAINKLVSQPVSADPIEFVTQAFERLFTWNPKSVANAQSSRTVSDDVTIKTRSAKSTRLARTPRSPIFSSRLQAQAQHATISQH